MTSRSIRIAVVAAMTCAALAVGLLTARARADDSTARAVLHNAAGDTLGTVKFIQQGELVLVRAEGLDFPALTGFKGFHIHANGVCDPNAIDPATGATVPFLSAGGHYNPAGTTHANHGGDMPSLYVDSDHNAWSRFKTDRFDVDDIIGRAVIVHAGADNFGNVPVGPGVTQYTPNSVGTTNATATGLTANTGNAGARYACGVIVSSH
jgi:superoxide dismutase, Cu-Zn family